MIAFYPAEDPAPDASRPQFFRNDASCLPALLRPLGNLLTMPQHWNAGLGKSGQSEAHWIRECPGCQAGLPLQKAGYIAAEWLHMADGQPRRDRVCWPIPESNFCDLLGDLRGITFDVRFAKPGSPKKLSVVSTDRQCPEDLPEAFDLMAHLTRRFRRAMDIFPAWRPDELTHEWVARVAAEAAVAAKTRQCTLPGMEPVAAASKPKTQSAAPPSGLATPEQLRAAIRQFTRKESGDQS